MCLTFINFSVELKLSISRGTIKKHSKRAALQIDSKDLGSLGALGL